MASIRRRFDIDAIERRLLDPGEADVDRISAFLESRDLAAAEKAVQRIEQAAASLAAFSDRGAVLKETNARRLTISFGRAAYLLDYLVDHTNETVVILRVRHSRETR